MNTPVIFESLWEGYIQLTPSAPAILETFREINPNVKNDHIALRTFNDPRVGIDVLARPFKALGYVQKGTYYFKSKKLNAIHLEKEGTDWPKVFISELILEKCSAALQKTIHKLLDSCLASVYEADDLILKGNVWGTPSYATYEQLAEESEYAGWMYVYGFCANHFTILVNTLETVKSLEEVNSILKSKGYMLNASGGEIKGTPAQFLQQSSTLADQIDVTFEEGVYKIPGCYYEFALRHPMPEGKLFSGFITSSADKIFESTDRH